MTKPVYDVLVVDGTCYPVPRVVSNWLEEYPISLSGNSSVLETVPDFVVELFNSEFDGEETPYEIRITSGSWENDRVLHIVPFLDSFDDMGYVRDWIKENDFNLGAELEYMDY